MTTIQYPSVSVVIRTKNESQYISEVLKRLGDQTYGGRTEVVLVDSGSSDNTVAIADRFGCRIIHLKPEEFSFGRALNIGISKAEGDIIIFLSGHSVPVSTDYFDQMVRPLSERGIAATFGRDIPRPDACPSQARDILNHFPEADIDGNKFSNANAAIKKEIWKKVRFDEQLSACEDFIWAQKVMSLGYKILYVPQASVFHSHTPSPVYIFMRYLRERRSMKYLLDLPCHGIWDIIKNSYWHTKCDFLFMRDRDYQFTWYFHIPFYRLSQELGLFVGSKLAEKGRRSDG